MLRRLLTAVICLVVAGCSNNRNIEQGARLYAENCLVCHGANLQGGGGAGVVGLGQTPSDLTILTRSSGGVFPTAILVPVLMNYAEGRQPGRQMRPFTALQSDRRKRIKTPSGRQPIPQPQAALLAYLKAQQRP